MSQNVELCKILKLIFLLYLQADIDRFKMKEERNKFKKAVPPNKRKHDESSDDDFTGSDLSSGDDEPEVKQRKVTPKPKQPKQQHVAEDYDFGDDIQDEVQDLDMDDLGSDEEQNGAADKSDQSDGGSDQSDDGESGSSEEDDE